jgi:hypothetical protein
LINPVHAHAWDWIDQPFIISRLLGGEGLRSPGFRLSYLLPVPWFSELHAGMQNADEGDLSFNGESVGGSSGRRSRYTHARRSSSGRYCRNRCRSGC